MRPDELERRLRERLDAFPPAARAELLHVLLLPDFERADRIGEFWGYRRAVLCRTPDPLRGGPGSGQAVLVGMLREGETLDPGSPVPPIGRVSAVR